MVVLVSGNTTMVCGALILEGRPDLSVVDELARLQLAARRLGCSIVLRGVGVELAELLAFAGLTDILPAVAQHQGEKGGEVEGGEEVGVEERMNPGDPIA